jgi:ATP-dependent 26S proteasome regulatory subunit
MKDMGVWGLIGVVGGLLVSIWAFLKYIVSQNMRLDDNLSKSLIPSILSAKYKFEINNEISVNKKYPSTYSSFAILNGTLVYFTRSERLLTAGWQSKETISELYYFRWHKSKIQTYINNIVNAKEYVNVMALKPWGSDKLGQLSTTEKPKVYLNKDQYEDIEEDIVNILSNEKGKTSALLYGKPGTGKTRLVKYFSLKYNLPIYSIFLNPEYNNLDILVMFNDIPEKCIVLFEDFDNYFDKRECIMKNDEVKFTFDSLLSVLDGVYNEYNQVVFFMTCNDINKIDDSIKDRPSRMKFVTEITGPNYENRLEILDGNIELTEMTEDMTTDRVFFVKSLSETHSVEQIAKKLNKQYEVTKS